MNLSEKKEIILKNNAIINENADKVYEAGHESGYKVGYETGHEAGQKSMIDESTIIKVTATSEDILTLDDVSEIPHDISIKVESTAPDVKLYKMGKNLISSPFGALNVKNGRPYTFSYKLKEGVALPESYDYKLVYYDKTGSYNEEMFAFSFFGGVIATSFTFVAGQDGQYGYQLIGSGITEDMFEYAQLEFGYSATNYELYIEIPLTLDEEGKAKIKSDCPKMTFASNVSGAQITVDYHRSYGILIGQDRFWESFQKNGARTNNAYAFYGEGWNDITYNPKHPIICSGTAYSVFNGSQITDTKVPIDIIQASSVSGIFSGCTELKTITKLKVDKATGYVTNMFTGCVNLENITIEGTIGKNNFNVQACTKLTHDSLMSIINALADYSTSSTTYKITLGSVNISKLTTEEITLAESKGWTLA